jgi:hypothetical protein
MKIPAGLILNEKNCELLECAPICMSTLVSIKDGFFTQGDLSNLMPDEIDALKQSAKILEAHTLTTK